MNIKELAEQIAKLSAYQDDNGRWWGHDTELPELTDEIAQCVEEFLVSRSSVWKCADVLMSDEFMTAFLNKFMAQKFDFSQVMTTGSRQNERGEWIADEVKLS